MSNWTTTSVILDPLAPRTAVRTDGDKWQIKQTVWVEKNNGPLAEHMEVLTDASYGINDAELMFWDTEISLTGWRDATEEETTKIVADI